MDTTMFERKASTTFEIKGYDPKSRRFEGVATKEIVDRDEELVRVKAFEDGGLDAFRKNPVMLLNHDPFGGPIGKVLDISIRGDEMPFTGELRSPDDSDRMRDVVTAVEGGYLKAFSIGFGVPRDGVIPGGVDSNGNKARRQIVKAELREVSLVAIGANSAALMKMLKTVGAASDDMQQQIKTVFSAPSDLEVVRRAMAICKTIDETKAKGLDLPRDLLEAADELAVYLWSRGEEQTNLKKAEAALRDLVAAIKL